MSSFRKNQDRNFEPQRYRARSPNLVTAIVLWNTMYLERITWGWSRQVGGRRAAAIPVAAGLGAHQPDWRLRLAAEPQAGGREVQAATIARKTLAYDFFRILRAPPNGHFMCMMPCTIRWANGHHDRCIDVQQANGNFFKMGYCSASRTANSVYRPMPAVARPLHGWRRLSVEVKRLRSNSRCWYTVDFPTGWYHRLPRFAYSCWPLRKDHFFH